MSVEQAQILLLPMLLIIVIAIVYIYRNRRVSLRAGSVRRNWGNITKMC
jgi:hypothetical protein